MINKSFIFLIPFLLISTLSRSEEITYKLRRFNENIYENSYGHSLKSKIEEKNEYQNNLKIIKSRNGNYDGYYKVGKPYTVLGQTYYPKEDDNYKEIGMASWYGSDFHDKKTANGETYNMNDYTAAHRTLPMPCIVKVTNLENGKSVNVRINDRGPFVKNRIIDVSKKAAKKLDFHEQGTTKIKVEFLKKETNKLLEKYGLR